MSAGWVSLALYYNGNLDRPLLGWVAPLFECLDRAERSGPIFFIRYWERGPHIRLRLWAETEEQASTLTAMAVSGAERFIRIEPSPVPMNEDAYRRIGTSLHDPGPLPPLEPNNSLASVAYEPDVHRYGGATALALVERNFMASSAIVLRFLRMSPPREERRAAGLRASFIGMAALEQLARSDLSTGLPHAVAVQEEVMERLPTQARSRMCKQYEQWAPELRRLWSLARARTLSESDDVRLWHQLVIQLLGARAEGSKPTNLLFPLLNCLHMHSNRLGIFPADEAFHSYSLIRLLVDG